jgi:NitT/TauT family transport system substrate-binding protein
MRAVLFGVALAALAALGCNNWAAEPNEVSANPRYAVAIRDSRQPPLRVAYSDWPGWAGLEIAVERGWFKSVGLKVELTRSDYVSSLDAFSSRRFDAVTVTNVDALVMGAAGAGSKMVLLSDYSNGNDQIIAGPGIETFKDLKGKRVGLELTMVDHLLFLKACEKNRINSSDIALVNFPTGETPQALTAGDVAGVAAWYPVSAQALHFVPGAKAVFTSADVPGLIYDGLAVSPASLAERRDDWLKFARVWYWIADYIRDPKTRGIAVAFMATKVGVSPEEYALSMAGTYFLSLAEAKKRYAKGPDLDSLYGSTSVADEFNVSHKVYREPQPIDDYIDRGLIESL